MSALPSTPAQGAGPQRAPRPSPPEDEAVAEAMARLRRKHRRGSRWGERIALAWLVVLVVAAVTAPWMPWRDPLHQDYTRIAQPPSWSYPLGTDALGRDQLSRAVFGARVSLLISLASVALGMVAGSVVGIVSGWYGGRIDKVVMVVVDALLSIPGLVLLMAITTALGRSLPSLIGGLTLLTIPVFARLARAKTLQVSQLGFVMAARTMGARSRRILAREITPNVAPTIVAYSLLVIAGVIVAEGALSFLGVGVPPPRPSWGAMIAAGRPDLEDSPHIAMGPALVMFVSILSINVLGERWRHRDDERAAKL